MAQADHELLGLRYSPVSASQIVGTKGVCYYAQVNLINFKNDKKQIEINNMSKKLKM